MRATREEAEVVDSKVTVRELRTYVKARTRRVWSVVGRVADAEAGFKMIGMMVRDPRHCGKTYAVFDGRRRLGEVAIRPGAM